MKDYTSQVIYLGIDVHKNSYSVTAICNKMVLKKATLPASPDKLVAFCHKHFPKATIFSAYEAGFSGFSLHRTLEKHGIQNIVIHASSLEVATGNKVKTDKRDSLKIASLLEAGRLKGIHVPSLEEEEKRAVSRIRNSIVQDRIRVGNQIKSFLHHHGFFHLLKTQKISSKWIENLKNLVISDGLKYALNRLIDTWQHLNSQIKDCDQTLKKQAIEDSELEIVYRSAPGIGPIAARVLANELGDLKRFSNERQLFSYLGLTPSEYSSGEHVRRGHITRQGKPIIRKILTLVTWRAIKKDKGLKETFARISLKAGKKRANIAVARRLMGHIRACFHKGCLYGPGINAKSGEILQIA